MGVTSVDVKVQNPSALGKVTTQKFLIDSGAAYSVVPAKILFDLGIQPSSKKRFILANGEAVELPTGNAFFEYRGEVGASPVIFGDRDDIFLLGVVTLESLGLTLDPLRRELKPLPMLLM